jgi:hypothetical protein
VNPARVGRPAAWLPALLALSSPLLILLALVALIWRPPHERVQAVPALLIGMGLLSFSWIRRRRRRRDLLRALREARRRLPPGSVDGDPIEPR